MIEIIKAGIYRLLFMGFNFLVGLFIAAISGSELFGTISLMTVNAAFIYLLTGSGADQAIVWHGASKKINTEKLFTFTLTLSILQILLFVLISIIYFQTAGKTLLSWNTSHLSFFWELIYFAGLVFLDKYISLFYAQHKARMGNLLLAVITFVAIIVLAVSQFHLSAYEVNPFQFFCLLSFLQGVSILLLFHLNVTVSLSVIKKEELFYFFHFSGLVFLTNIIQFFAYRIDYWLINYFIGTDQVGIYSQANRFAGLLWIIPNIIAALLVPVFSSSQSNFKENELAGLTRISNYLNLMITGVIVFISFLVYTYFLRQDYFDGFIPLLYMLPGFYFFSINILFAAYFSAHRHLWINLTGSTICLVVIMISDLLLIPLWGISGAAIANTIAYTLTALFSIMMFFKITKLSLKEILFLKKNDWRLITKLRS